MNKHIINLAGIYTKPIILSGIFISLASCGGGGGGGSDGSGGATGGSSTPNLTITDIAMAEENSGTTDFLFSLVLDSASASDISFDYATADQTGLAAEDYNQTSGMLTILAGDTDANISVSVIGDACYEEDETFSLTLSNPSSNVTLAGGSSTSAVGTITNDDDKALISLSDSNALEGNTGTSAMTFTASLNKASCFDSEADYASNIVTADALDFVVSSGQITIPAGDLETTFDIEVNGDEDFESDETFTVNLSNLSDHLEAAEIEAFGTIIDDDSPQLSVVGSDVQEGNQGDTSSLEFFFTLEAATDEVTVDYTTFDGGATAANNDYTPTSGTLTIPAGQTQATVSVEVIGDNDIEPTETLELQLSNLTGTAYLASFSESGAILDDDAMSQPTEGLRLSSGHATEGDEGTTTEMFFTVSVEPAAASNITVNYETVAFDDAAAGVDYLTEVGSVVILAGESAAEFSVTVQGDAVEENDEAFYLNITSVSGGINLITQSTTGLIVDDDGPASDPRVNTGLTSVTEGNSGVTEIVFDVTLTAPASSEVSVDYTTQDDTAFSSDDYTGTSGTLTFPIGTTALQVPVDILGDTLVEANESFDLLLSNIQGAATLGQSRGTATIITDDPFPFISISDANVLEGDIGTVDLEFTISATVAAADDITVDYETQDVSTDSADYIYNSGTLTIPAGDTEITLIVVVNGDTDIENDEALIVELTNPSANAEISVSQGSGSITNDDGTGGWGEPERIDISQDSGAFRPDVATNSAGHSMAIWSQDFALPDTDTIESRIFDIGQGWQATSLSASNGPITASSTGNRAKIDMDAAGNVIAAWAESSASLLIARELVVNLYTSGAGWGVPETLYDSSTVSNTSVNVDVNSAGQAAVVFLAENTLDNNYDDVWVIKYDPISGWDAAATPMELNETLSETHARVAIDEDGNIIVVWNRNDGSNIPDVYFNYYLADTDLWATPALAESNIDSANTPIVITGQSGEAAVFWEGGPNGSQEIFARFLDVDSGAWLADAEVIGEGGDSFGVALDASYTTSGDLFVTWQKNAGAPSFLPDIWANRFDFSANAGLGAWDTAVKIELDDSNYAALPRVASDALGNAIVVWYQDATGGSFMFNLRAARYDIDDGGWQPAESIEVTGLDNEGSSDLPRIAMDNNGNATVVWERTKLDGIPDIWTIRYTNP